MFVYLVGCAERQAIIILATVHIALIAVFAVLAKALVGRESCRKIIEGSHLVNTLSQLACTYCRFCHYLLEGTQTIVKGTFAATTGEGEVSLKRPLTFIICILEGRDYGSKSLSLECTGRGRVIHIVGKQRIVVLYRTALESQLPVDGQMMSLIHKYDTCRIVIHTVNTYRSLTAHHSVECYVLVCVGEQATCKGWCCTSHRHGNTSY